MLVDPNGRSAEPPWWVRKVYSLIGLDLPKEEEDGILARAEARFDAWIEQEKIYAEHDIKIYRAAWEKYFGEGDAVESGKTEGEIGTGHTLMNESKRKSAGSIGVAEGESDGIIMVDDFPSPGAGNAGSFSRNILGQPVNGINRAAEVIKHGREAVDRLDKSSASGESDSVKVLVFTACGDTVTFDSPLQIEFHSGGDSNSFDTLKVENK